MLQEVCILLGNRLFGSDAVSKLPDSLRGIINAEDIANSEHARQLKVCQLPVCSLHDFRGTRVPVVFLYDC